MPNSPARAAPSAALLWVALGAWAGVSLSVGTLALARHGVADLLSGDRIAGPPERPNRVRNALELVSFASGAGVAITALAALGFARGQLAEMARQNALAADAERDKAKSAKADLYARLFAQFMSPDVEQGLEVCRAVGEAWSGLPEPRPGFGDFVRDRMDGGLPDADRRAALRLLSIVESLGLLTRLELIEIDDVFYTFEGVLRTVRAVFGEFMQRNSTLTGGRESEHALWLLGRIAGHVPARKLPP